MDFFDNFLDDTHRLLRDTCRRFAEREIAPHALEWEEAGEFPRELYRAAAQAGLLGAGFPEEVGGGGGGPLHVLMAIEGLMRGGSTGVVAGLTSLGIALPAVIQAGDPALIDRYVRPVLAGDLVAALAITEPGTGSDVAAVRTRAVRDGDDYIVDGAKLFITSGVRADLLTTLVRTGPDPHGGLSFLVIEKRMPGVTVARALRKTGWWASDTAELAFDGVRVPAANRLGPEGSGFTTLMRNFQTERLALAGIGCATARIALEEATRYARERTAFGRPLAGFQVTRHKLAEMATRVLAATTLTYQVALRMARGDLVVKEVSMAKNVAAEAAIDVTSEAVQIHGGMGYMRETLVERLSRDARLLPIGGGTQEVMREIIAKTMGL
jgi:acyl-CoA dehydrogenase